MMRRRPNKIVRGLKEAAEVARGRRKAARTRVYHVTFQMRLKACQQDGNLMIADLARWFDRPHATVRSWINDGRAPGGGPVDREHAERLLALLELLIRQRHGFPVPRLTPRARIEHLREIRQAMLSEAFS